MKYNQTKTIQLGSETLVSDPCYNLGTWCQGIIKTMPGNWICDSIMCPEEGVTAAIRIKHESLGKKEYTCDKLMPMAFSVGVDSGMAGFYDVDYFKSIKSNENAESAWYERICDETYKTVPNETRVDLKKIPEFRTCLSDFLSKYCTDSVSYATQRRLTHEMSIFTHFLTAAEIAVYDLMEELGYNTVNDRQTLDAPEDEILNVAESLAEIAEKIKEKDFYAFDTHRKVLDTAAEDGKCFVSSTAYGDGGYTCYVHHNQQGEVVYAKIFFGGGSKIHKKEFLHDMISFIHRQMTPDEITDFLGRELQPDENRYKAIRAACKEMPADKLCGILSSYTPCEE